MLVPLLSSLHILFPLQEQELGLMSISVPKGVKHCTSGGVQHDDLVTVVVVRTQNTKIKHW